MPQAGDQQSCESDIEGSFNGDYLTTPDILKRAGQGMMVVIHCSGTVEVFKDQIGDTKKNGITMTAVR